MFCFTKWLQKVFEVLVFGDLLLGVLVFEVQILGFSVQVLVLGYAVFNLFFYQFGTCKMNGAFTMNTNHFFWN